MRASGRAGAYPPAPARLAVCVDTICLQITATQALLILRDKDQPEATDGPH